MANVAELRPTDGPVPPHDLDAEAAVLSAILIDPSLLYEVQHVVRPLDFYSRANGRVFEAIEQLEREASAIDLVTVAGLLKARELLGQVGGTPYLAQLQDATPAVSHIEHHARIVAAKAYQRRMIATLRKLAAEGYGADDAAEWGQRVESEVYEAARWTAEEAQDNTLHAVIPEAIDAVRERARSGDETPGISTGWPGLDRAIGGWRQKVYVIAGRPGMGKSAFAAQALAQVAAAGFASVLVSLEMDRDELALRVLANEAQIDFRDLESGRVGDDGWQKIAAHAERIRALPMSITAAKAPTVAKIRTLVRQEVAKLRRQHGPTLRLGAIGIDYIQLIDGEKQRGETRDGELSRVCKELQWMTREFECALLELSQLNRGLESRPDKRPTLSDLRESGSIEQEAFGVLFPFRESYYDDDRKNDRFQDCEIIIAKHRNGAGPTLPFVFEAPSMRFEEKDEWRDIADQSDMRYP